MKKIIMLVSCVVAIPGVINVYSQTQVDTSTIIAYTYTAHSTNKETIVKMVNDELNQTGVQVYFFNKTGKLLGKWEINDTSAQAWALSPRGNYFMCEIFRKVTANDSRSREVVVMDNTGKELFSYQSSGGIGRWSPSEDYFIVHDYGFTALRAYDLKGKVIWEKKKPENVKELSLAEISKNGEYIALVEYPKTVILLSKDGRERYRKDFEIVPGKLKRKSILTREIDNDGNILLHPGASTEIRVLDNKGNMKLNRHFARYDHFLVLFSTSDTSQIEITNKKKESEKTHIKWR